MEELMQALLEAIEESEGNQPLDFHQDEEFVYHQESSDEDYV